MLVNLLRRLEDSPNAVFLQQPDDPVLDNKQERRPKLVQLVAHLLGRPVLLGRKVRSIYTDITTSPD